MKYFGQFLIEKKIISSEILVDALLEQISLLPSTCQIVRYKNLLGAEQILKALEVQSEREVDFKKACMELGFWSQEISNTLNKELNAIRIPIGHILLKKGSVTLSDLTKALDEFLSNDQNFASQDKNSLSDV